MGATDMKVGKYEVTVCGHGCDVYVRRNGRIVGVARSLSTTMALALAVAAARSARKAGF